MRRFTIEGVRKRLRGATEAAIDAARSPNGVARIARSDRPEDFPAGLNRWLRRYSGKNRSDFPPHWRHDLADIRRTVPQRLAVIVHVYYEELLSELFDQLAAVTVPFDLFVTNSTGHRLTLPSRPALAKRVHLLETPNRGRDILPLIFLVNAGVMDHYELVLKVHTKQSSWRDQHDLEGTGASWRRGFLHQLLGSESNVDVILDAFANDPTLGLVTSDGNVLGPEQWGGDLRTAQHLLARLQLEPDPARLRFAAGSMYWIRGFVLQGLFALDLSHHDFEEESGQVDGTTAHALERIIGIVTEEAGFRLEERKGIEALKEGNGITSLEARGRSYFTDGKRTTRARAIPFYLPQFHPFAENDLWWGEGFTEWSNVTSARPVFRGHAQPLLPSVLGFYDLRSSEVRRAQYELAHDAGVEGFMYYYYWFAGRRLMREPLDALVASGDEHPFCIMWANENWSRRWDGSDSDILISQDYDEVPAERFIEDVAPLLRDPRYIRVDGRPLLAIYKITQIPNFERVIRAWRQWARDAGIGELLILTGDVGSVMEGLDGDPREHGLDGSFEFPPHNTHWVLDDLRRRDIDARFRGRIMRYASTVDAAEVGLRFPLRDGRNPGVMVGFDNTARRQWQPDIWFGANPYTFRRWLDLTASALATRPQSERIIFINAWNEWAESAVLEPTARYGRAMVGAVRSALVR